MRTETPRNADADDDDDDGKGDQSPLLRLKNTNGSKPLIPSGVLTTMRNIMERSRKVFLMDREKSNLRKDILNGHIQVNGKRVRNTEIGRSSTMTEEVMRVCGRMEFIRLVKISLMLIRRYFTRYQMIETSARECYINLIQQI